MASAPPLFLNKSNFPENKSMLPKGAESRCQAHTHTQKKKEKKRKMQHKNKTNQKPNTRAPLLFLFSSYLSLYPDALDTTDTMDTTTDTMDTTIQYNTIALLLSRT
jgi:hypothetical protein